ncbi:MAG: regulatory protein RecX [Desulfobacterales bacterium]|nr:regulatory protein RecX [Desulfobacterales bacterium]
MTSQKKPEIDPKLELPGTDYQRALNSALRILTGRDHSRYELVQKLKQRGFPPDIIEKVVLECERLDYVDDNRTSRVYIRKLMRKGYGAKRIRVELERKGLSERPDQGVISQMISDIDELEVAGRIIKKNIKRFEREIDPRKRKNKIYRFLLARGFSAETIGNLLKSE